MALTEANLKTRLADFLQTAEANLETLWTNKITTALADANNTIESILIGERGFTAAQVAAWDNIDRFVQDITFYYIFTAVRNWGGQDPELVREWRQRIKELRQVAILDTSEEEVVATGDVVGGDMDDGAFAPVDLEDSDVYFEDN